MKIDKDIPMPDSRSHGPAPKYPFSQMSIGDSVFFEGCKTGGKETATAHQVGRRKGWRFSSRTQQDGVRIWRIA